MVQEKEIYGRIDNFVVSVLIFTRELPQDIINRELIKQIVRSCSSIGANAREGQTSQTKKEVIRCFSISKREAKETWYWLTLISKLNSNFDIKLTPLIRENEELIAILSTIILTSKKNMKN